MAVSNSDNADSPDIKSSEAGTPNGAGVSNGVAGAGAGAGAKRAVDEDATDGDQITLAGAAAAKKKKTGPGSRGVANLTPEQLAKKRANDREAQRAIRERTKNQIENLERRIKELTSQKPYQELQAVIRAKEAAEQENIDLKQQLVGVINVLRPLAGLVGDTPASSQAQTTTAHVSPSSAHPHYASATTTRATTTPVPTTLISEQQQRDSAASIDLQNVALARHQDPAFAHDLLQSRPSFNAKGERLDFDSLLRPGQRASRVQAAPNRTQDTQQPYRRSPPMLHDYAASHSNRGSWSPSGMSGSVSSPSKGRDVYEPETIRPTPRGRDVYEPETNRPSVGQLLQLQRRIGSPETSGHVNNSMPKYAGPIRNSEPSCSLDSVLLNFISERHQRIAEGLAVHEALGPRYPSVSSLLNPANNSAQSQVPVSKLFTNLLAALPDIPRLPERVAILYVMFLLLRWQISPTRENYAQLPIWLLPQQCQLDMPHPAWIDHIPFAAMRERLIRSYNPYQYDAEKVLVPYIASLRVTWPYEEMDALLQLPDSDEIVINPVFQRHLRNIDNWRLGKAFASAYPALSDTFALDRMS